MVLFVIQWILLIVKVSEGIIDTCPNTDIIPSTRVAKMCQTTKAMEDDEDGNDNFDSVALSLTEQKKNCSCYLSVKNVTSPSSSLYIKQYQYVERQSSCGMEIDIDQHRSNPYEIVPLPGPIPSRCNSTVGQKQFSLFKNERLQFISRIVDGNFNTGYCIQIIRVHHPPDGGFLELSCGDQEITKTTTKYTSFYPRTTLNDATHSSGPLTSISSSPTSMIDKSYINDKTDSEGDSTLYIAVGAGGGFVLCVALLVVILVCKRRNSNPSSKGEIIANSKATTATDVDDDNDGLEYNVLYVSSEQHEDIDVNYSTADDAMPRHAIGDDEGGYSTVDENNKFQISNLRKYQVTDAALEINEENGVKHFNAPTESGCVYAVADKTQNSNNSVKNVETGATYAVVNKNRLRHSNEGDE